MFLKIIKSRIFLLVIIPIFFIWIIIGYYYSLGKLIKTDNAYVKAPIISVQSEVSGKIKEVLIKNNQFVKKDQILLTIDSEEFSIKLIENEQILKSIEEEIKSIKSKLNEIDQEILIAREDIKYKNNEENRIKNLIDNKIKIAKSEVNFFKLEFDRQLMLNKKGFGIKKHLEDAKFKLDKAKRNLISLNFNKEIDEAKFYKKIAFKQLNLLIKKKETILTTLGGSRDVIVQNHPLYLKQKAVINGIKLNIRKSTIKADKAGFVGNMNLEKGEFVRQGQNLFVVVQQDKVYIEANFKETQISNFRIGQKGKFTPDSYPNLEFNTEIESLSPTTGSEFAILPTQNASGNWVKVVQRVPIILKINEISNLNDMNSKLKIGMTVSVVINTEFKKNIPIIVRPISNLFYKFQTL
tara:strand:+ start:191 stop:1417 length:1227 start_codon:yes stop_codon:yes gene_type:complete